MPGLPFPTVGLLGFGSPPYRPAQTDHRYYSRLRLPNVHLRLVRCSLSSPDTLYRSSLFVVPCELSEKLEPSFSEPGVLPKGRLPPTVLYKETSGSPKSPDYPFDFHLPVIRYLIFQTGNLEFTFVALHPVPLGL